VRARPRTVRNWWAYGMSGLLVAASSGCSWNDPPPPWHSVITMDRSAWTNDYRRRAAETNIVNISDWETNRPQGATSQTTGAGSASTPSGVGSGAGSSPSTTGSGVGTGIAPGTAGTSTGFSIPGVSSSSTGTGLGSTITPAGTGSLGTGVASPASVPGLTNVTVPQISPPASSTSSNLFGTPR
jgi:hypothetical protein